MLAEKVSL